MANSAPKIGLLLTALACFAGPGSSQPTDEPLPISLDADSSSFDRRTETIAFRGLRITQGSMGIEADEAQATGLDFEKSEWHFSGNVRITIDSATIRSDNADLRFEAHELLMAELSGEPAMFEDLSAVGEEPIRGGANLLYYDNVTRTLRMSDGAWLSEGTTQFTGCDLIYDLDEERITSGSSECGQDLQIIFVPPADEEDEAEPGLSP